MAESNKDLLELENRNLSTSTVESVLLVCKKDGSSKGQSSESKCHGGESKTTSSLPTSQVLGKVRDFLGIMSESNKMLEKNAKDNAKDFNIEMLNDNESEYIEMDLMLGVADLHTPEAIAAAEAAMAGGQQVISIEDDTDSENSSSSKSDEENDVFDGKEEDKSTSSKKRKKSFNNKKQKIVELP